MKKSFVILGCSILFFSFMFGFIQAGECEDKGYSCRDASCSQGTETRIWDLACSYEEGRPQVCCRNLGANENRGECFDSDGGDNSNVKGQISNDVENHEDSCLVAGGTFKYVAEYYCEENFIKSKTVECLNGCNDGVCRGEVKKCIINIFK